MKLSDWGPGELPREKMLAKGPGALSNAELLAILLRTGTGSRNAVELARVLLLQAGGRLTGLADLSTEKMATLSGIGKAKALSVAAALEVGRRFCEESASELSEVISTPQDICAHFLPLLKGKTREECWAAMLNKARRLIHKECFSLGGTDQTVIDNKLILARALEKKAHAVILVHNHPTGVPRPSQADIKLTGQLKKALGAVGILLLDHIILSDGAFYSFADEQLTVL